MKKLTKYILAVVSLLIAACVLFVIIYNVQTQAVTSTDHPVLFKINAGENQDTVLENLKDQDIIKSVQFASLNARISGNRSTYEGYFELNKSWSTEKILSYLNDPSNASPMEVSVLLVEGSWARDMAKTIAAHTTVSEDELLELWSDPEYIQELMTYYDVLTPDILENTDARVLLEGFLYPDTYTFNVEASAKEVTELIIANSQRYYEEYRTALGNSEFSHYELMTLASIVEYEANTDEDMRRVAGVFMNRLNTDMALQSSVTVCYALYDFKDWKDCESESPQSPYNTYIHAGLTPGPILNPSLRAIVATLDYESNDYFFFIADVYGDGSVHYQKTYAEHEVVRKELLGY